MDFCHKSHKSHSSFNTSHTTWLLLLTGKDREILESTLLLTVKDIDQDPLAHCLPQPARTFVTSHTCHTQVSPQSTSPDHQVIWSPDHQVTWSSSHLIIKSPDIKCSISLDQQQTTQTATVTSQLPHHLTYSHNIWPVTNHLTKSHHLTITSHSGTLTSGTLVHQVLLLAYLIHHSQRLLCIHTIVLSLPSIQLGTYSVEKYPQTTGKTARY